MAFLLPGIQTCTCINPVEFYSLYKCTCIKKIHIYADVSKMLTISIEILKENTALLKRRKFNV